MRTWAAEDERRGAYARDVASIYLALRPRARARSGASTPSCTRGVRSTRCGWRRGAWGEDPVFFYGFDDLHPLERDAVETLARVVGVAGDRVADLRGGARGARRPGRGGRGAAAAGRARCSSCRRSTSTTTTRSRAALHHLERKLFEPAPSASASIRRRAVRLLEAGGERAEAELVAAEVLELLRAGMPGEEIAVVYRSPAAAAPRSSACSSSTGSRSPSTARCRSATPPLGRGLLALARCALLGRPGAAPRTCSTICARPGCSSGPEIADGLEAEVRRRGLRTAAQARERLGWTLGEIDALRGGRATRRRELARQARRLFAAPAPGARARCRSRPRSSTPARWRRCSQALSELDELGERLPGAELIELLEGLDRARPRARSPGRGAGLRAAGDPRAAVSRRCSCAACRRASSRWRAAPEPFLSDERRRELAACSGLRLAPAATTRSRASATCSTPASRAPLARSVLSYRSSDEEGNLALPSPFIADVAELLDPDWPDRRRRRMLADVVWPAERGADRARAGPHRGGRDRAARPASVRRRCARCPTARFATSATARSCRAARSRPTATVRSNGWWSASCSRRGSSPTRIRSCAAATCTRCSRR